MKRQKQLSFIDVKIASIIPPDDPLKTLFQLINFSFIYDLIQDKYTDKGRKGYDPVSLFKALLLIYLGYASSERDLARKLRYDGRLSYLCGFSYGDTPNHNTFHYFRQRLGEETFSEIVTNLIAQALCLIKKENLQLSIDSSHIEAKKSDPHASWGRKSKDFSFFGYKVHLEVTDTELPIPLAMKVSPGNEWDGKFLKELTEESKKTLKDVEKRIDALIADAGYDSTENANYLIDNDITPVIAENPRGRENPIQRGDILLTPDGKYTCKAGFELAYWGRESKRKRFKFRCGLHKEKAKPCLFSSICWQTRYGPVFYLKEDNKIKDMMRTIRSSKSFSRLYKKRTIIERFYSILKESHRLENIRMRGIKNIITHVCLSISAYLTRWIAGMKLKVGLLPV
ncbi:MAG: transposase [Methanothermobacter tenebrarum]